MRVWVRVATDLKRNRKLREFAIVLGCPRIIAQSIVLALWQEVMMQQEDGNLSRWSDEAIADCCDLARLDTHMKFQGDAAAFVKVLQNTGWLDPNRLVHDWLDYAGPWLISKYARDNRPRLEAIWKMHGRVYGERAAREKEKVGGPAPAPPRAPRPSGDQPPAESPQALSLAALLADLMRKNDPSARVPSDLGKWALEAEGLLFKDRRHVDEAIQVLAWCQADSFWKSNILSMGKFRAQYSRLKMQMERPANGGGQPARVSPGRFCDYEDPETGGSCTHNAVPGGRRCRDHEVKVREKAKP